MSAGNPRPKSLCCFFFPELRVCLSAHNRTRKITKKTKSCVLLIHKITSWLTLWHSLYYYRALTWRIWRLSPLVGPKRDFSGALSEPLLGIVTPSSLPLVQSAPPELPNFFQAEVGKELPVGKLKVGNSAVPYTANILEAKLHK